MGASALAQQHAPPLSSLANAGAAIDAVFAISRELAMATSLRALLLAALRSCARLVPTQHSSIFMLGEDDGSMVRTAQPHDELGKAIHAELDVTRVGPGGLIGRAVTRKKAEIVPNAAVDPDFDRTIDSAPGYVVRSCLCAPIEGSEGRVLAAVQLCNRTPMESDFTEADSHVVTLFTQLLAPCLERQLMRDGFF